MYKTKPADKITEVENEEVVDLNFKTNIEIC